MSEIDSRELERIQRSFPELNVVDIYSRFKAWSTGKAIRSPAAMLFTWCKRDEETRKAGVNLEEESSKNRNTAPDFSYMHRSVNDAYGKFRLALLIEQVGSHPPLTPAQIADRLMDEADTYPEITKAEISHLLSLGDDWKVREKASPLPQSELLLPTGSEPHADDDIPF